MLLSSVLAICLSCGIDSGIQRALAPIHPASAGEAILLERKDGAIFIRSGSKTLIFAPFDRGRIGRDGTLSITGRFFPKISKDLWGYADQIILGRSRDKLLGLEITDSIRDPDAVLHEFKVWSETTVGIAWPSWNNWLSANISPVLLWDPAVSLCLATKVAPWMNNAVLDVAQRGDEVLFRAISVGEVGVMQSVTVAVRIRPDHEKANDLAIEIAPFGSSVFRFTTDVYQARVEATPPLGESELQGWLRSFSSILMQNYP